MSGRRFYHINQDDLKQLQQSSSLYHRSPSLIGYYECNNDNILPGKRIKYLHDPNSLRFPIHLKKGLQNIMHKIKPSQPQRLQIQLKYAMSKNAEEDAKTEDGKLLTSVYAGRRALTQIMQSYWNGRDFNIEISRYNGSLFIAGEMSWDTRDRSNHNFCLEQLLFKDSPHDSQIKCFDRNIFFTGLYEATIGHFNLLYAAEVQGIEAKEIFEEFDDVEALNKLNFVFLKTLFENAKNIEQKMLTFWLQSYLSNVKNIYLATKTYKGTISDPLKHITVSDIPNKCRSWTPQACFGLLNEFLKKVEQLMADVNSLDTVYEFIFVAKEATFYYNVYEGKTEKSFIPQTYADFVLNK